MQEKENRGERSGHAEYALNRIGRRSFVGNNALLPIGSELGSECLLGVLSVPPREPNRTEDTTEWLGSPSFRLPFRKRVEGFSEAVLFRPTAKLRTQRLLIDALRILIPYTLVGWVSVLEMKPNTAARCSVYRCPLASRAVRRTCSFCVEVMGASFPKQPSARTLQEAAK